MTTKVVKNFILSLPLKAIFQRLPGLLLISVMVFALIGPIHFPYAYAFYHTLLHILFFVNNSRSAYSMVYALSKAKEFSCTDWLKKYCLSTGTVDGDDTSHDLPLNHIMHCIILPNYKENLDTLCDTLEILASHSIALSQYSVCLAMEETELKCVEKAKHLIHMFSDYFYDISYTVHPQGRLGEIRGKSSNVAWAAYQQAIRSGGGIKGRHDHELLTIMDADTGFAEDYFQSISYFYATASPEQRKILMFAPSTVFDRNSTNVPVFVRVTDMFWSIGVMSNYYGGSPVKIPCSAYSISMDLAISVNFWDSGPEAIGEDLHMYLKCFFATKGHLIVQQIFSPASQCNVEGSGDPGIKGYLSGLEARYTQAKRHLWGSLDTGYTFRKTLLNYLSPETQTTVSLKNTYIDKLGKDTPSGFSLYTLFTLFHRLIEAHIMMGHLFTLIGLGVLIFPVKWSYSYELSAFVWQYVSDKPLNPIVESALNLSFFLRVACLIPNIIMISYYEAYTKWAGFERWALQQKNEPQRNYLGDLSITHAEHFKVTPQNSHLKVQHLGKRSSLASVRTIYSLVDWFCIPIAGFLFYVLPQYDAQLSHLYTDKLNYCVAKKAIIKKLKYEDDLMSNGSKDEGFDETKSGSDGSLSPVRSGTPFI